MDRPVIVREIEIEAPPGAVWPFMATAEGLRTWWISTESVMLEARMGGRFELRVRFGERAYLITGRVTAYDPPRTLALTWREEDGDWGAWPEETVVTFSLTARQGRTHVRIEHSGFDRLPAAFRDAASKSYEGGWTQEEMDRLRSLVTSRASGRST